MQKRFARRSVCKLLAFIIMLTAWIAVLSRIDLQPIYAATSYSTYYKNVDDEQLDLLTNRDTVSNEKPQITVFVHGLGSQAYHWSNDGNDNFDYQMSSMPEQLRLSIGENNAVMYGIKVAYTLAEKAGENYTLENALSKPVNESNIGETHDGAAYFQGIYSEFKATNDGGIMLYDCNTRVYPDINQKSSITSLTKNDTQKHIILIFDQFFELKNGKKYYDRESNDFVYSQLEYCLDAISYQYLQLTGELPTYNLVSHSRGGLTIMQYALGHPYNVASLYTVGSAFDGSEMGRVKISGENVLLNLAGYNDDYTYDDGTTNYAPGILDLVENTETLDSYRNFWNTYYDDFYSNISFTPIGSYATLGCAFQVLAEAASTMLLKLDTDSGIGEIVDSALRGIALVLDGASQLPTIALGHFSDEISGRLDSFWDSMKYYTQGTELETVINALSLFDCRTAAEYSHIGGYSKDFEFVILDDLFLHLDSQIADGYSGRNVQVKCFYSFDQIFGEKKCR